MMIPVSARILKSGFVERGLARPICENFVEDLPKTIFGHVPHTHIRHASKHLHKTPFTQGLLKHFKAPKAYPLGPQNLQRKLSGVSNIVTQALTKRQEYIAIPAALLLGQTLLSHLNKKPVKPKSHYQKMMDGAVQEIQNYAFKFSEKPLLSSLAIASALYGTSSLINRIKHSKAKQQETVHETS